MIDEKLDFKEVIVQYMIPRDILQKKWENVVIFLKCGERGGVVNLGTNPTFPLFSRECTFNDVQYLSFQKLIKEDSLSPSLRGSKFLLT